MEDGSLFEQLAELDAFAKAELSQAQRDVAEVRVLIRQTTGEVERLTQRHSQALSKQREAEARLGSISREELRQVLNAACDGQMRLFMMQSQLEQLQSRQRSLDKLIDALQRTVEVAASASSFAGEPVPVPAMPQSYSSAFPAPTEEPAMGRQAVARVIHAQEDERNRIARQIHDGPAQALTNIVLRAEICERLLGADLKRAGEELAQLKTLVTATLRDTRRFIFDVRPMILDDLGLFPTLRKYLETFEERSQFAVELAVSGQERRLDSDTEIIIFRIVQEALQNAVQHANPSRVRVGIDVEGGDIQVVVEDDGVGFDAEEVLQSAREQKGPSFGIASMLQRVEMLGGRLTLDSAPGRGTRLMLAIPVGS